MPISLTQLAFEQAHEPQRFQDLVFAEPLVREQLQGYANRSCWNHLLLHGSYGVGKSIAARVIVQERLGTTESGVVLPVALHQMDYQVPEWSEWMTWPLFAQRTERWLGKFGQPVRWISCLTAAMLPRIRSEHDETHTADAQPGLQGKGGSGGDQG